MLLLGHMGITLAAMQILDCATLRRRRLSTQAIQQTQQHKGAQLSKPRLMSQIDIRLLLLGSLLPDIIDKPLGYIFLRNIIDYGRIYCHTLLFAIIISTAAFYLWKYKHKTWLISVAFGVLMHLVLDEMWLMHRTLLWPLYGWNITEEHGDFNLRDILDSLVSHPSLYVTEIIGGLVLIWIAILIVRKKNAHTFLRTGRL